LANDATLDDTSADDYLVFFEGGENSGVFYNTDDDDDANIIVSSLAKRGTTATFTYNDDAQSFTVANDFGTLDMDESSVGDEWNSGENLAVTLVDQDLNKNTLKDEDMNLRANNSTIPSLIIGTPITLTDASTIEATNSTGDWNNDCR